MQPEKNGYILDTKISALRFNETLCLIDKWIKGKHQKYVCVCNTHSLVTGHNHKFFKQVLAEADLCVPDGMPLVFALRKLGFRQQERVDGPNLMLKLCEASIKEGYRIFLYGGTAANLVRLKGKLCSMFPGIQIVGSVSPPFRDLSEEEKLDIEVQINNAEPDLVFVSLGCPKQELWMHANRSKVKGIMIGVGAAYDFILGDIKRPPVFFQKIGLEWVFRLLAEPRRLFKRYAYNNPAFVINYLKNYRKDRKNTLVSMESDPGGGRN